MEQLLSSASDTASTVRYIDMTPEGRLEAVNRVINGRLAIEASPSFRRGKRAAVESLIRVAKSRGDAWALAEVAQ